MSGLPGTTRSSAMDGGSARPTMTGTNASGCGAESVSRAGRPSRSCPIGWHRPGTFTLRCRQQACERIAAGDSAEQAAPHCKDPTRLPDPSTVRRWAQRRLLSVWCWLRAGVNGEHFLRAPTILAWDLGALCRILPIEARSP